MSDHVVLYVDRLTKPENGQENGEGAGEPSRGTGTWENEAGPSCSAENAGDEEMGDDEPLLQVGECRICQEEDSLHNLETPCACSGSLKVCLFVTLVLMLFLDYVILCWCFMLCSLMGCF